MNNKGGDEPAIIVALYFIRNGQEKQGRMKMRNYMKEYREALDERSLFELDSEKWNAADEKLDGILRDGTVAHDDRIAREVCECIEQLLDIGSDWNDALVQKYVKLLDDNGYGYLNDNTKKVYEINDESEAMKGFLEKTYEKMQQLKQQMMAANDSDTKNRICNELWKIEKSVENMDGITCSVWFYYKISRGNANDYINIDKNVGNNSVIPLINGFRKFGVEHFTFSSTQKDAAETAWQFKMNGCELEGLVEVNVNMNFTTGECEKIPAYKFMVK